MILTLPYRYDAGATSISPYSVSDLFGYNAGVKRLSNHSQKLRVCDESKLSGKTFDMYLKESSWSSTKTSSRDSRTSHADLV